MTEHLPIYYAEIATDEQGIYCVSLVDCPAVKSLFVTLADNKHKGAEHIRFAAIENEEQRLLLGVIMRADYPIYRRDGDYEYYLIFAKDTIRQMAEKMLVDGYSSAVDLQHDNNLVDGVHLQELFIKDSTKGICPKGFEDIEEGSLFGVYKVHNDDVWEMAKRGECAGFSLAGIFHITPESELQSLMAEVEEIEKQLNNL